jgi:glucose-1-phosphate thymidylyltransferase
MQIACLEEIAYYHNWLSADEIRKNIADMQKTEYGKYLLRVIAEKEGK